MPPARLLFSSQSLRPLGDLALMRAQVTAHEVGHQLGLAIGVAGGHRNSPPNLMQEDPTTLSAAQSVFDPRDIAAIRMRVASPGELPGLLE